MISLAKAHYINQGIKETGALSINVVDESWLDKADKTGCVSGNITDKSLIWQDNTYYVRGYLSIRTQKIEDSGDLLRFFPFEINKGQKIKAVIDIGLIPGTDNYQMTDISYIWLSEEG